MGSQEGGRVQSVEIRYSKSSKGKIEEFKLKIRKWATFSLLKIDLFDKEGIGNVIISLVVLHKKTKEFLIEIFMLLSL